MTSRGTDGSSGKYTHTSSSRVCLDGSNNGLDDGIMTPSTDSVRESATETSSLLIKDETVRRSRAESERIAKLRLEMENKRLKSRLQERARLSKGDYVIISILFIFFVFW